MSYATPNPAASSFERSAAILRVGLGAVFVIGGWNKLSQLIDPAREAALVGLYMSPAGYINAFFADVLFGGRRGEVLTPWGFLAALSSFELVAGVALMLGLLVRPLALTFGLMLWTFVMALPVVTAAGVPDPGQAYTAPALLVQVRDVGLSGMMFVLFNLGAGAWSVDRWVLGAEAATPSADWQALGLLLRLSVAVPLAVGGLFAGWDHIASFATHPLVLLGVAAALLLSRHGRGTGVAVAGIMLWYIAQSLDLDRSALANLNAVKRELAFLGAGLVLALAGGGVRFTAGDVADRMQLAECMFRARHLLRRCVPRF